MKSRLASTLVAIAMTAGAIGAAKAGTVAGTAAYLERIALPPNAVLDVKLLDVSLADAMAIELSTKRYAMKSTPAEFSLEYDDAIIDERHTYTVSAEIRDQGKLLFRTTMAYPVITRGAPTEVDVVLEKMSVTPVASLKNSSWTVNSIQGKTLDVERLPSLKIAEEGSFAFDSSCNVIAGKADFSKEAFSFPQNMMATLKACPPPYDELETDVKNAMSLVASYQLDSEGLTLLDTDGKSVFGLSPAK